VSGCDIGQSAAEKSSGRLISICGLINLSRSWIFFSLCKAGMVVLCSWLAIGAAAIGTYVSAAELKTGSKEPVMFNIPSQPLADALVAYGAATGLEVYYDGTLALGKRSAAVEGSFTAAHGLEILLDGTGYWPRATARDTFTLISLQHAELPARVTQSQLRQHEQYFAALQAGITAALCDADAGYQKQIIFSFWVTGAGAIYGAKILGSAYDASNSARIIERIDKINIGTSSPAEVPQPITMAVYPPSRNDRSECPPSAKPATGR
jgi:hypothetical protein